MTCSRLFGRQRGAALIVAVLVLLIISIISVSGASRTLLQERMASNQYEQTKSFMAAETGLLVARTIADSDDVRQAVTGKDADMIEEAWKQGVKTYEDAWQSVDNSGNGPEFKLSPAHSDVYWNADKKQFEVLSKGRAAAGTNNTARRTLGASITPASSSGPTLFTSALIGRDGVTVAAGAQIDTYNSNYGAYDHTVTVDGESFNNSNASRTSKLSGVSAKTCSLDATITLSGGAPVYGDVLGTGDLVSHGGPQVYGNVHVNGDADFDGYVYGNLTVGGDADLGSNAHILGNVRAGGDFNSSGDIKQSDVSGGTVAQGTVTVDGDAYFSSSSRTRGAVIASRNVELVGGKNNKPPAIKAGGTITFPSYYDAQLTDNYVGDLPASELDIPAIQPVSETDSDCSSLLGDDSSAALATRFSEVRQNPATVELADWLDAHDCSYCYQESDSTFAFTGGGKDTANQYRSATNTEIGATGQSTLLYVNNNVSNEGSLEKLTIRGHVTLLVDGNFTLSGAATIDVGSAATLTLLVTGRTALSSGTIVAADNQFVREGPDGKKQPAIAVYTTYDSRDSSKAGVTIAGANDSYITVYSPNATVDIAASGDIYGSVVAKEIDMSGDADIHYDEALKTVSIGPKSQPTDAYVASWWQVLGG